MNQHRAYSKLDGNQRNTYNLEKVSQVLQNSHKLVILFAVFFFFNEKENSASKLC